jgi:hypothetical protein
MTPMAMTIKGMGVSMMNYYFQLECEAVIQTIYQYRDGVGVKSDLVEEQIIAGVRNIINQGRRWLPEPPRLKTFKIINKHDEN